MVSNIQIKRGKTETVIAETTAGTVTTNEWASVESDSILVSLYASAVGTSVDLVVYGLGADGQEVTHKGDKNE